MANPRMADPIAGYLDDLLSDGTMSAADDETLAPWNAVLREAVASRQSRQAPLTTLPAGMAMIPLLQVGDGNCHQRFSQWLWLQSTARSLPAGRLRQAVLQAAQRCGGAGGIT